MDEHVVAVGLGGLNHLVDGLDPLPDGLGMPIKKLAGDKLLGVHLLPVEMELLVVQAIETPKSGDATLDRDPGPSDEQYLLVGHHVLDCLTHTDFGGPLAGVRLGGSST